MCVELTKDQNSGETTCYSWSVCNKYYSATIVLQCVHPCGDVQTVTISPQHYEAVVLFVDSSTEVSQSRRLCNVLRGARVYRMW